MISEIIHIGIVYMMYDNHRGCLPDPSDRVIRTGNFVQAEKPLLQVGSTRSCRSTFQVRCDYHRGWKPLLQVGSTRSCRSTFTQFCKSTFQVRNIAAGMSPEAILKCIQDPSSGGLLLRLVETIIAARSRSYGRASPDLVGAPPPDLVRASSRCDM